MQAIKTRFNEILIVDRRQEILAAINWNAHRPWLYPLRTPHGREILREFPPDHGFHNGVFLGHTPIVLNQAEHSFWGSPPFRGQDDPLADNPGDIKVTDYRIAQSDPEKVRVELFCSWETKHAVALIEETRSFIFSQTGSSGYSCRIESQLSTQAGKVSLQSSKFSGLAMRLAHEFTHLHGASVMIEDAPGSIDQIHEQSAFDHPFTLFDRSRTCRIHIRALHSRGQWFFRQYGLLALNACMTDTLELLPRQPFTTGLELQVSI
jgi:hypothetical protein